MSVRIFKILDPVRIVTDRPLKAFLRGNVRQRRQGLPLRPTSYLGAQGFVCGMTLSRDAPHDSPPTGYHVTFYAPAELPAPDLPEGTEVPWFPRDLPQPARLEVDGLRPDDLEPDPEPPEPWEQFWDRQVDEGEYDVDVGDLLSEAGLLLNDKRAGEDPDAFRVAFRAKFPELSEEVLELALINTQADWPPEGYAHESVASYLEAKTEWEGGLWTPDTEEAFAAIRAAEAGDRGLLDALMDAHASFQPYQIQFPETPPGVTDTEPTEVPTTACFDCDTIVPVAETWVNKKGLAMCEGCFTKREAKGRARRGRGETG